MMSCYNAVTHKQQQQQQKMENTFFLFHKSNLFPTPRQKLIHRSFLFCFPSYDCSYKETLFKKLLSGLILL